jgi:CheY-like chemotaxis protein
MEMIFRNTLNDKSLQCNLEMPEMVGRHAAKLIKAAQRDIPLIALTATFHENIKKRLGTIWPFRLPSQAF